MTSHIEAHIVLTRNTHIHDLGCILLLNETTTMEGAVSQEYLGGTLLLFQIGVWKTGGDEGSHQFVILTHWRLHGVGG